MESTNTVNTDISSSPLPPDATAPESQNSPKPTALKKELLLALGALGVVYGDLGTSPLYALKECFTMPHGVAPTTDNILSVLSLFVWSLFLVVVVKYLTVVMRADNRGEGGIMALLTLLLTDAVWLKKHRTIIIITGLFGSSLLWADGMITPAITVLSAIEGLEVATKIFIPYIIPITVGILIALFMMQKRGTAGIGAIFGPAMLIWFVYIGLIGIPWIMREPTVLMALNPYYAITFFVEHKLHGFFLLGSVVLCITGCEALYADMGHFGPAPIRIAWYTIVFPGLLLNYFGQGALLLMKGNDAIIHPFYMLTPGWLLYPSIVIAAIASIIASQALITGAFSLAQQAMHLGYSPRWTVQHTSEDVHGQIYIPEINFILMIACTALVVSFKSSSALASAYGLAVSGTMVITTFLLFFVMVEHWKWQKWQAWLFCGIFLIIDGAFLFANLAKIASGGWFPLVIGLAIYTIMTTWKTGQSMIGQHISSGAIPLEFFMADVEKSKPYRVSGTAVFLTSNPNIAPPVLMHHFKHNKVLHEKVILLSIRTEGVPIVSIEDNLKIKDLGNNFYMVTTSYGYMQVPNVPLILRYCENKGLPGATKDTSYFLGRVTVISTGKSKMSRWQESLFSILYRNARPATSFFRIPPNRVIELGMQIKL